MRAAAARRKLARGEGATAAADTFAGIAPPPLLPRPDAVSLLDSSAFLGEKDEDGERRAALRPCDCEEEGRGERDADVADAEERPRFFPRGEAPMPFV